MKIIKSYIIYILIILAAIIICIDFLNLGLGIKGIISTSSDLILGWTILVIVWYSYETLMIKKIGLKQNIIQMSPILIIYYREKPSRITIRNIGKGPAFNVTFGKIYVYLNDIKKKAEYSLKIDDPPVLVCEEERLVKGDMKIDGKSIFETSTADHSTVWIEPKYTNWEVEFSINYSDMENNRYESKIEVKKDTLKLLSYKQK